MREFVNDVMEAFMSDPDLPHRDIFVQSEKISLHKEKMYQYFKFKFDGSKRYIGTPIEEVHKNMGITHELFDKAATKMLASLKKMNPKLQLMREVIKRINDIKSLICFPVQDIVSK